MLPDVTRSRIFDGLTEQERRTWLTAAQVRDYRRGQTVVRQGEPADVFYLVERGFLKLIQLTPEGQELIVRFVGPGEPFGGIVALEAASYPVTGLAIEPTRLRGWPIAALGPLLDENPQVRINIMREIATHMTDALTRVRELATKRVGQRLAHTLLRLMRQCGRATPDGVHITHTLTRQELAELTGTTLYTVSRTLSQWEADGVIRSAGRQLIVRSPKRLDQIARTVEE
jgi:CRP-like cAMP-binding protein